MSGRKSQIEQRAAEALAALGSQPRLRIFKALVQAGRDGANIGALQKLLNIPATTLGHHLGTLARAGLVEQERRGREVICVANFSAVNDVLDYVKAECCAGLKTSKATDTKAA